MLEPLTRKLAKELSKEIADHCFTADGGIRPEIEGFTVGLSEPQQYVAARMAADVAINTELRHVRCVDLVVTKRGEKDGESKKKSKKVSPGAPTLRAQLNVLVDPTDAATREFLMCRFGNTFLFEFQDEVRQLDFGSPDGDDEDEDGEPKQPRLKAEKAPPAPVASVLSDVLDEQRVVRVLSEFKIELQPGQLMGFSSDRQLQLLTWAKTVDELNAVATTTHDDLPKPPAFLFERKVTKKAVKAIVAAAEATARKPRAPRRSSAEFKNTPRVAGTVHKITDRKRGKAVR